MQVNDEQQLAAEVRRSSGPEMPVYTTLSTNERVIARVTDGIYREPSAALRELISNAYDADATQVVIKTNAPWFDRIMIEDNGLGMRPEVLAHLIKNIGGSAKRTLQGEELGISRNDDTTLSPSGRKLIGKLGIGLFSVSQLTRSFQIITKVKSDAYKTVAVVNLHQFADAPVDSLSTEHGDHKFDAGEVMLWREKTTDLEHQGTSIILTSIRPQTKDTLRSAAIWDAIDSPLNNELDIDAKVILPRYYIGRLDENSDYLTKSTLGQQNLPWTDSDLPLTAFRKMVDVVWSAITTDNPNPKLDLMFDSYLQMVWRLSLALPIPYVYGHLFDEPISESWAKFYLLSNDPKGRAEELRLANEMSESSTVRNLIGLENGLQENSLPFEVLLDDLALRRPIRYRELPNTNHALKEPLVFLGKMREDFFGYPRSFSAGPLSFEAYFYWAPKIAPVDHRGALIRIHDASGSLFDDSFFKYQVSEQTRLRQITCEIFVSEGLEPALNIDREAFNTAHPHMVVIIKWVHSALRQLATAQKRAAQIVRESARSQSREQTIRQLESIVDRANQEYTNGEGVVPDVFLLTGCLLSYR